MNVFNIRRNLVDENPFAVGKQPFVGTAKKSCLSAFLETSSIPKDNGLGMPRLTRKISLIIQFYPNDVTSCQRLEIIIQLGAYNANFQLKSRYI